MPGPESEWPRGWEALVAASETAKSNIDKSIVSLLGAVKRQNVLTEIGQVASDHKFKSEDETWLDLVSETVVRLNPDVDRAVLIELAAYLVLWASELPLTPETE